MSGINPHYKGCVFCGKEECDCPYTGKETPGRKIITQCVCPPIPIRSFDWQAYDANTYDGPGSPLGEGATEQEAVADLMEQLEER